MNFSKKLILIGSGGHARVLMDVLRHLNYDVSGVSIGENFEARNIFNSLNIIRDDVEILNFDPTLFGLVNAIGSVKADDFRKKLQQKFSKHGYLFPTLIHPSAILGENVSLGEGCQIMAGAILQPGVTVGEGVIINTGAQIDHDCQIGPYTHIGPGAILSGGITVGECSHIGVGAVIIQGIEGGSFATVAGGSVVIRDVGAGESVAGVPSRKILLK